MVSTSRGLLSVLENNTTKLLMDILPTPITLYEMGSTYSSRLKAIRKWYGTHKYRRELKLSALQKTKSNHINALCLKPLST